MPLRRKKAVSQPRSVALLIETSNAYCRGLLQGIRDYLREHQGWAIHLTELGRGNAAPWFAHWQGDGIIARIDTPALEAAVRRKGVPVVNVSGAELAPEFPAVIADGAQLSQLAADHLLERGFRHFGFCGDCRFAWANDYSHHFVSALRRSGHACDVFDTQPEDATRWRRERRKLTRWIASLRKPVGIMVCYDIRGQHVLDVCRQLGLSVPAEVAVIGQHNDELVCSFCDPPLSSVMPDARRAGFESAQLLDAMMHGRCRRARHLKIAPLGVVTRQSTDVIAIEDRRLAEAVRFMRTNACRGIGIPDILKQVRMSRTAFERKFRRQFGHAPYEEIMRIRCQRARELLSTTRLAVAELAERAGFSSGERLCVAFRQRGWSSPRTFRSPHAVRD